MAREIHKIYDGILRIIIFAYLQEFLRFIGENREIDEVLKGDITTLNGTTKYLDFHCKLKDGTHCHIEFQFPTAYSDDLERFFDYNITVEVTFGERTETIIFNFSTSSKGACERISARQKSSVRKPSIWEISILKKDWSLFTSNSI